ncbi:MAG TPA: NAD(P)-dependent dehydrogenase, partial [Lysinibacillus sp.]|nr:NAD(P)-dependent dehydrogenase [Lysinibacillus sp.]
MKFDEYREKTVFITGAASGIGHAQVIAFLENGATVFGLDIEEQGLIQLQQQYPDRFAYKVGSVSSQQDVEQSYKEAISLFGQIDILCNTAGILDGFAKTLDTD